MIKALQNILILASTLLWVSSSKASDYERAYEALAAKDYEKAAYFLSFFESNGDARSQYNMGIIYRDGLGFEKIPVKPSVGSCSQPNKTHAANYAVGLLLRDGPDDLWQPERAVLYLKEADLGHLIAPLNWVICFSRGIMFKRTVHWLLSGGA